MTNAKMNTASEWPKIISSNDIESSTGTVSRRTDLKCQKANLPAAVITEKLQIPKIVIIMPNHVSEKPISVNSNAN